MTSFDVNFFNITFPNRTSIEKNKQINQYMVLPFVHDMHKNMSVRFVNYYYDFIKRVKIYDLIIFKWIYYVT